MNIVKSIKGYQVIRLESIDIAEKNIPSVWFLPVMFKTFSAFQCRVMKKVRYKIYFTNGEISLM